MSSEELTTRQRRILDKREKELEQAKRKNGKRKKGGSLFLLYVVFAVILLAAIAVLLYTVVFRISDIQIEGETIYSAEQIVSAAEISTGESIFSLNPDSAQEKIRQSLLYIDTASVEKKLPGKVIISVTPATQDFAFYSDGQYFLTSSKLKVFDITHEPLKDAVRVSAVLEKGSAIGADISFLNKDEQGLFLELERLVNSGEISGITHVFFDGDGIMNVVYDSRIIWKVGSSAEFDKKLVFAYTVCSGSSNMDPGFIGVLDLSEYSSSEPTIRSRARSISGILASYFSQDTEGVPEG